MPSMLGFKDGKLQWIEGPENHLGRELAKSRPDWDSVYRDYPRETMPWFQQDLDADLASELDRRGIREGHFLDLGTGTGCQALALASLGFQVTATDISAVAIEQGTAEAKRLDLDVAFRVDDILSTGLETSGLETPFDYILDRGCFHALATDQQPTYVRNLCRLLKTGGLFFLKCFSTAEQLTEGPKLFSPSKIRALFHPGCNDNPGSSDDPGSSDNNQAVKMRVESIRETAFQNQPADSPKSLFCVLRCETS